MSRTLARIILITAGLIWGIGFVGNKIVLDYGYTDAQLLFVRFTTAALVISLVFMKRVLRTNFYTIKWGLFLGIFLYLGFFFQTWGLKHTTASNNALITAGYIILMPLIIFLFERTKVRKQTIVAGFITMVGIVVISVDFSDLTIAYGDSLTFIGAVFYALHIYLLGQFSKKTDLPVLMTFQLIMFAFISFVVVLFRGGLPHNILESRDSSLIFLLAIVLGVFGSFVAFLFQSIGQKYTNEAEAAILISTESVFGPLFAIAFYNDPFNIYIGIGIVLVFIGVILSEADLPSIKKSEKR
jgi:drug/metabolite transporter (DMT)-like permease